MKTLLAAAWFAAAAGVACACEPGLAGKDVERVESQRYVLAYRSAPRIAVSEHFALELAVCAKNGAPMPESLRVNAHMPLHRHGMNYTPSVERIAANRWRADGLLFHMLGQWEFQFDLRADGVSDHLTQSYVLN